MWKTWLACMHVALYDLICFDESHRIPMFSQHGVTETLIVLLTMLFNFI